MTREPIEVTRQDRIFCLKANSDYHSEDRSRCRKQRDHSRSVRINGQRISEKRSKS